MIVVTGAAGFIGSCLANELYRQGHTDLLLVDQFDREDRTSNLKDLKSCDQRDRMEFINDLPADGVECIFHIGARTDTTEFDVSIFDRLNLNYSKTLWNYCVDQNIPFIYASSAATYGDGQEGFEDKESDISKLKPLNPYGDSKQDFDVWVLNQTEKPPFYAGLKFFNVYGPNEYHKGRMASVVFHTFNQIKEKGSMKLFQSHRDDYKDGEQMRDFVYVKDVVKILMFWYNNQEKSGIYNLGSGQARSFLDLAAAVFVALGLDTDISFIPTPEDIRDKYQYFTEASMERTLRAGYTGGFHTLEEGVTDYVKNYLSSHSNY